MSGAGFLRGTMSPAKTLTALGLLGADRPVERRDDGRLGRRGGHGHPPARGQGLAHDPGHAGARRDGAGGDQLGVDLGLPLVPGRDRGLLAAVVGLAAPPRPRTPA